MPATVLTFSMTDCNVSSEEQEHLPYLWSPGCRSEKTLCTWLVVTRPNVAHATRQLEDDHDRCQLHRGKTVSRSDSCTRILSRQSGGTAIFRNVARTRFRDSTRRIQKNHFGSRRLGVLSRSLGVNGIHGKQEETNNSGISGILLEHAQREIPRRSVPLPARKTGALGAFTSGSSSSTAPYGISSNAAATSNLGVPHILGDESCESWRPLPYRSAEQDVFSKDSSLREEANRVLEFSRTIGLCNYLAPPTPALLTSRLSPEAGVGIVPPISR
jgi:hypothetical protein